jgi:hypothetical protein
MSLWTKDELAQRAEWTRLLDERRKIAQEAAERLEQAERAFHHWQGFIKFGHEEDDREAELQSPPSAHASPQSVRCPACDANPGEQCRDRGNGSRLLGLHDERVKKAESTKVYPIADDKEQLPPKLSQVRFPLAVTCPSCGARPRQKCYDGRDNDQQFLLMPHHARVQFAKSFTR